MQALAAAVPSRLALVNAVPTASTALVNAAPNREHSSHYRRCRAQGRMHGPSSGENLIGGPWLRSSSLRPARLARPDGFALGLSQNGYGGDLAGFEKDFE